MLEQALQVRPGDNGVLGSLNRLYRAESMWAELLGEPEAAGRRRPRRRPSARKSARRSATSWPPSWRASKTRSTPTAWRSRKRPTDAEVIAAVREIGSGHEDLRRSVAEILVPVLEQSGRHAELCDVLELRLSIETEPTERVQTLRTIARVLGGEPGQAEGGRIGAAASHQRAPGRSRAAHRARTAVARHLWALDATPTPCRIALARPSIRRSRVSCTCGSDASPKWS